GQTAADSGTAHTCPRDQQPTRAADETRRVGGYSEDARTNQHSDDNGDGIEQTKTLRELARGGSRSPDCDAAVTSIATHQALRGQGHWFDPATAFAGASAPAMMGVPPRSSMAWLNAGRSCCISVRYSGSIALNSCSLSLRRASSVSVGP